MEGGQPFAAMGNEDLEETVLRAGDNLQRQRGGLELISSQNAGEVREPGGGNTGAAGVAVVPGKSMYVVPNEGNKQKGLVSHKEGWFYVCEFDFCERNWSTGIVGLEQISALVDMYKLHVQQCHEKKESSAEQDKFDKDQAGYAEATRLKSIEAHKDNRVDILSPVRFWPKPLRYKYIAEKQPAIQTPVWDRIDFSHLGLQLSDSTIVKKIHNRNYATAELGDFSNLNLGLLEADKDLVLRPTKEGGMKQIKGSKNIASISEAVMALMNCLTIWNHIHPCDYGTEAIVRFLVYKIHHQSSDRKLTVKGICKFFKAAFKGNADRVLGPEGPMTYQEIVTLFNSMDWTGTEAMFSSSIDEGKRKGLKRVHSESSKYGKKYLRPDWCFAFNSIDGCKRSSGDSCRKDGKVLKHCCSFVDADGKMCTAKDHGEAGHEQ